MLGLMTLNITWTLHLFLTSCYLVCFFKLSTFLRNCFLFWDHWNGDVMPTLDTTLLCSSREGFGSGLCVRIGLRSFVNWVSSFPSRVQYFSEGKIRQCCVRVHLSNSETNSELLIAYSFGRESIAGPLL